MDGIEDGIGIHVAELVELGNGAVCDELVGDADADDGALVAMLDGVLLDGRADATDTDAVLHGDDEARGGHGIVDESCVERLGETEIVVGDRQALALKGICNASCLDAYGTEGEQRDIGT